MTEYHVPRVGELIKIRDRPHVVRSIVSQHTGPHASSYSVAQGDSKTNPQEPGTIAISGGQMFEGTAVPDNARFYLVLAHRLRDVREFADRLGIDPKIVLDGTRPDQLRGRQGPGRLIVLDDYAPTTNLRNLYSESRRNLEFINAAAAEELV